MNDDSQTIQALKNITISLNAAENAGQASTLEGFLATENVEGGETLPLLAFMRANGTCVGAQTFLSSAKKGGDRQIRIADSDIVLFGQQRALVTCVVTTGGKDYHNVRLFVRTDPTSQDWKLFAWANEPMGPLVGR